MKILLWVLSIFILLYGIGLLILSFFLTSHVDIILSAFSAGALISIGWDACMSLWSEKYE